jgi:hypothetical protein
MVVLNGFAYTEYRFTPKGIVHIGPSQPDYMLYRSLGESTEPFFQRLGQLFLDLMLHTVLNKVRKEIAKSSFAPGLSASGKISIVDPFSHRRQVARRAQFFKSSDYVAIGEGVAADVDFTNYSDSRFADSRVESDGGKVLGDRGHNQAHPRKRRSFFHGLRPALYCLLIDPLGLLPINSIRTQPEDELRE